jgi:hypothetical protein|tara:strand:- start:2626 stop:2811 length:186 start_codon:yes stop_codon:yes gene_type:complete
MIRADLVIGLITLGCLIGVLTTVVITKIKQKESMPQEPVVCVVQMNSKANNQTHNFKGVVK